MKTTSIVASTIQKSTNDYSRRAYAAMRQWGDADRDDEILEGACDARELGETELDKAGNLLAALHAFLDLPDLYVVDFFPALLKEAAGGEENLAMDHGITIPGSATARRKARTDAIRRLAKVR